MRFAIALLALGSVLNDERGLATGARIERARPYGARP